MNKLDILKAARNLITDPKNWTKGTSARNKYGRKVTPWCSEAVCWCSMGAIAKAANFPIENKEYSAAHEYLRVVMNSDVARFNDERTHRDVLNAFDTAINELENLHA
jgi:hypothetical protein